MIGLNKIGLNQVQLNQLYLNTLCACQKSSGGDGFPRLPGDVTRWSFKGLTNEQMSKNPRLEDADHKGRFLTFKNFLWDRMSGCNGYSETLSYAYHGSSDSYNTFKSDSEVLVSGARTGIISLNYQKHFFDGYIRVSGLDKIANEITGLKVYLQSQDVSRAKYDIKKDGIYKIQIGDINNSSECVYFWIFPKRSGLFSSPVTIEILPNYPGFIIGDGVDDYAVTEKDLDFEDTYTVYTAFIPSDDDLKDSSKIYGVCGKDYAKDFYLRYSYPNRSRFYSVSYNLDLTLSNGFNLIACKRTADKMQFKNLLTGASIEANAKTLVKNPGLYYLWRSAVIASYAKAAIAGQVICNGHFTTDEEDTKVLNWYKKEYPWLFFDQAWTVTGKTNEETDRATIANITGNGNNLVLSNFGFAGNSGYGEYVQDFNALNTNNGSLFSVSKTYKKVTATYLASADAMNRPLYWNNPDIPYVNKAFKLKLSSNISGLSGLLRFYDTDNSVLLEVTLKEGINSIPALTAEQYESKTKYSPGIVINNAMSVDDWFTLEQIPDHEGYLVTDGVDDKVYSSAFTLGKKFTVVGEWIFIKSEQLYTLAGIVKDPSFFLYNYQAGTNAYILSPSGTLIQGEYAIKAIRSSNIVYLNNWDERKLNTEQNAVDKGYPFYIGWNGTSFTRLAFKNAAIYGKELSKEDAIKAYIYLQTLKAK